MSTSSRGPRPSKGGNAPVELHALREGDGHRYVRSHQWHLNCPHMGAAERTLYMRLSCLVSDERPVRKLALSEIARGLHKGPVAPGEPPKFMSVSGVVRLLNNLGKIGQVVTPEGKPLRVSNGKAGDLRIAVAMYPRHACDAARTVYDDLARIRGEEMRYPDCSADQQKSVGAGKDQQDPVVDQQNNVGNQQNSVDDQHYSAENPRLTCDDAPFYSSFNSSTHSSSNGRARAGARESVDGSAPAAREEDAASPLNGGSSPSSADSSKEAVQVVGKLKGLLPSEERSVAVAVDEVLARGHRPEDVLAHLARRLGKGARSVKAVYLAALKQDFSGAPAAPVRRPVRVLPQYCRECDGVGFRDDSRGEATIPCRHLRLINCPDCHGEGLLEGNVKCRHERSLSVAA
jgi:hypothetical protein